MCADRRSVLGVSIALSLRGFAAAGTFSGTVHAAAMTKAERDELTPDDVLARMKKGNERFSSGRGEHRSDFSQEPCSVGGRHPIAVLLSCIDLRPPAETVMDLCTSDVFSSRVGGNVEASNNLGDIEFACNVAGAKVVLVMGHTGCSAIKGAIDGTELAKLTGLLAKIKPAVEATAYDRERSGKSAAFVDAVARKNVELTVANIRKDSPRLAELESSGRIKIAGAMYDLNSGKVDFFSA